MRVKRVVCLALVLLFHVLGGCVATAPHADETPGAGSAAVSSGASAAVVTPTPTLTASPTAAPVAEDSLRYYVVEQNNHQGVVDSRGQEVLPCSFAEVEILADSVSDGDGGGQYTGPIVFFAVPAVIYPTGREDNPVVGYLYDTAGRKLSEEPLARAYRLGGNRIAVTRVDDSGTYVTGLMDYTGKLLIPIRYLYLTPCHGGLLALSGDTDGNMKSATLFDGELHEAATAPGTFDCYDGQLIVQYGLQGEMCRVVDERLQPVDDATWTSIWMIGEDRYVATDSMQRQSIIDHTGKVLMPAIAGEYGVYTKDKSGEFYTVYYAGDGVGLLDGDGRTLYHTTKYSQIWYGDGAIVVYDEAARIGTAVDLRGEVLVPEVSSFIGWNVDAKLLMSQNDTASPSAMTFTHLDGRQFTIERASYVSRMADDRLLVYLEATEENGYNSLVGMTDDDGNWILPPEYERLEWIGNGVLVAGRRQANGLLLCGLMDMDGKEVLPAKYDSLWNTYEGNLLHARVSTRYGLIDRKGNWVWSASDYSTLVD